MFYYIILLMTHGFEFSCTVSFQDRRIRLYDVDKGWALRKGCVRPQPALDCHLTLPCRSTTSSWYAPGFLGSVCPVPTSTVADTALFPTATSVCALLRSVHSAQGERALTLLLCTALHCAVLNCSVGGISLAGVCLDHARGAPSERCPRERGGRSLTHDVTVRMPL